MRSPAYKWSEAALGFGLLAGLGAALVIGLYAGIPETASALFAQLLPVPLTALVMGGAGFLFGTTLSDAERARAGRRRRDPETKRRQRRAELYLSRRFLLRLGMGGLRALFAMGFVMQAHRMPAWFAGLAALLFALSAASDFRLCIGIWARSGWAYRRLLSSGNDEQLALMEQLGLEDIFGPARPDLEGLPEAEREEMLERRLQTERNLSTSWAAINSLAAMFCLGGMSRYMVASPDSAPAMLALPCLAGLILFSYLSVHYLLKARSAHRNVSNHENHAPRQDP